jgi:hypothetical protein
VKRVVVLSLLAAGAWPLSGCFWLFDPDGGEPVADVPDAPVLPPSVVSVDLPSWPPLGPTGQLTANLRDDRGLSRVDFDFNHHVSRTLAGGSLESVTVTGEELGEGFGTLQIRAFDFEGGTATRAVTDLLVDLTPPKAELGKTVVRAKDDHLELWVADAWVLGAVTLGFQGSTQQHVFDEIYPSTLGEAWDYSLVKFASESLVEGEDTAELTVTDAAGNTATYSFVLTVDGTPPVVSIQQPAAGSVVSGPFAVTISASDAQQGSVWLSIEVDGTPLATAVGPLASVAVDAGELTPGAATLVVRAHDEAGNVGITERPIVVE